MLREYLLSKIMSDFSTYWIGKRGENSTLPANCDETGKCKVLVMCRLALNAIKQSISRS
jgi:hypothetical protein